MPSIHATREQQGFIEGRIKEIEQAFPRTIIDVSVWMPDGKVIFGATIDVYEESPTKSIVSRLSVTTKPTSNRG